ADERAQSPLAAREHLDDAGDGRGPAEDEPPVVIARQDGGHGLARDRAVDRAEDERRDAEGEEGHDPEPACDRNDGETSEDPHARVIAGPSPARRTSVPHVCTLTDTTEGRSSEASGRVKLTGFVPGRDRAAPRSLARSSSDCRDSSPSCRPPTRPPPRRARS